MSLHVKALLQLLHDQAVRCVLFGTLGAIAYGAELTTSDMDLCFETGLANRRRVARFLTSIRARPTYVPSWNTEDACAAWTPDPPTVDNLDHEFTTALGRVDIVPYPFGPNGKHDRLDYARLKQRAVRMDPFGIPLDVASLDDIIASKLSAGRAKDHMVLDELRRIQQCLAGGEFLPGLERAAVIG
jgi:hypothetical protein